MLALGQAGGGAGGCHSCVNNFGVAQYGNNFLCNQDFAANLTVLALGQAGGGAGGCHSCVDDFNMLASSLRLCNLNILGFKRRFLGNFLRIILAGAGNGSPAFVFAQVGYNSKGVVTCSDLQVTAVDFDEASGGIGRNAVVAIQGQVAAVDSDTAIAIQNRSVTGLTVDGGVGNSERTRGRDGAGIGSAGVDGGVLNGNVTSTVSLCGINASFFGVGCGNGRVFNGEVAAIGVDGDIHFT